MDRPGIVIAGVCVYGGVGTYDYEVELMDESGGGGQDPSHTMERWSVMEVARGTFGPDDSVADIVEIKFERPVPVKVRKRGCLVIMNDEDICFSCTIPFYITFSSFHHILRYSCNRYLSFYCS